MTINKQLIPVLFTAFLVTSCSNLPNIKISIEENRTEETAPEPQAKTKSESEVATTTEPQTTEEITQNFPNENESKAITQSASGITPQQLNRRAKYFTVRIDGMQNGSGVIIDESDNTYTVLTNWHVVQEPGQYTIQTSDGREHQVNYQQVQQLPGVDLALVKFTSEENYQTAKVGDSDYLSEGQAVHLAGYPGVKTNNDRIYRFYNLNIVSLLDTPINQGYSVLYEGETISGMSGSPLLDDNGNLVGIHGIYRVDDPAIRKGSSYAIPINTYKELVAEQPESTETLALQPSPVARKEDTKSVDNSTIAQNKQTDDIIAQQENATESNSGIQEGQLVNNGLDNQLKVELLKIKRIKNPESEQTGNTVVVKLRVKRLVENCDDSNTPTCVVVFSQSKARNVDTYEEYGVIFGKSTKNTHFNNLPLNAWAEAYFWLDVPKGIEVIDIIFPYTEIFVNVPIES